MNPLPDFRSEAIRALDPYVPGEQPQIPGLIKLNTNENPYPPSPRALEAVRAAAGADLRLYPDPESTRLRQALAALHAGSGITPAHVFVGNGSDEVLGFVFMALLRRPRPILFPDISYSFYPVWSQLFGVAFDTVPLDEALQVDVEGYRRPNGGILIPNPNAPTGSAIGLEAVRALAAMHPESVLVIDEAYVDFGAASAVGLVRECPNLLVVQTASKSRSLAGLRVGWAYGHPALVQALDTVKNSFNSYPLDRAAQAAALAAVEDTAYFADTCARVIASRERLASGLRGLGFEVLPSAANFLFARHPGREGAVLHKALRERAILVRHFAKPRIADYLRITVGTDRQCDALVAALGDILGVVRASSQA